MDESRSMRLGEPMFLRPEDAMASIEKKGFNWRLVREYFRFTDNWLSEGQYRSMLDLALASIEDDAGRSTLLDMLDLQYAVFLEQVALQERMLGEKACEEDSVAFGERVMAYLAMNGSFRTWCGIHRVDAWSALHKIPAGTLIHRLLGDAPEWQPDFHVPQQDNQG